MHHIEQLPAHSRVRLSRPRQHRVHVRWRGGGTLEAAYANSRHRVHVRYRRSARTVVKYRANTPPAIMILHRLEGYIGNVRHRKQSPRTYAGEREIVRRRQHRVHVRYRGTRAGCQTPRASEPGEAPAGHRGWKRQYTQNRTESALGATSVQTCTTYVQSVRVRTGSHRTVPSSLTTRT